MKNKRLLLILLTLLTIAALVLAACGEDDDDDSGDATDEATEVVTEEPTEEPTEEMTEEATEEPTEEMTEEATEEVAEVAEAATETPTEEPTEEMTEEATEEPTEEMTEEATEEPTEEMTEEATEEATPAPEMPEMEQPLMGAWETCETPTSLSGEIPLGVIFTLTGGGAVYGNPQQQAVQLALEEVNSSGYLGDATIVATYEDSTTSPEGAIAAMTKLVEEDGVVAVIGPTLSNEAFAADPIAQDAGVPVLGVSNTATGITDMGDFVFRDSLPESAVIPGNLAQAVEILGIEKVGILYSDNDDFTVSGYNVFVETLGELGVEIVREETFQTGDTDFNAQLTSVLAEEPDAIVLSILAAEAVPMIQQARAQGFTGPIIGGNGVNSPAVVEQAGEDANGLVVGAAWHITNASDINQHFVEAYSAAYDANPDQFTAQAYTGAWLMATAIRCADSADSAAIRDALAGITDFDSPLGSFSFDETRNPVHDPVAQIVVDGKFELLSADTASAVFGE